MNSFDFYPEKPELIEHEPRNGGMSMTVFSLVLFILSLTLFFADQLFFIVGLVIVLIVHEVGHYLLMKKFNYQSVRMLFVPLMGAFVHGKKDVYSQRERFWIVLAGPIPGIVLGSVSIMLAYWYNQPLLLGLGALFIAINWINLIPLDPLDGGQLFQLFFPNRGELFLMIFSLVSSLAIIGMGWWLNSWIMILFGFFLGFRVRSQQKNYHMHNDLDEDEVDYHTTYKQLTNRDFSLIKEVVLSHTPALRKYVDMQFESGDDSEEELNAVLASQVNSVLVNPLKKDTSFIERLLFFLTWGISIASPLIIYWIIDKNWVSHVISSW